MAEHGNRSERHEWEIKEAIDAKHDKWVMQEEARREETEKFNEKSRAEHADAKPYESGNH